MNESSTKINYTSEYGMFHFLRGNRDLNEGKINKIINSVHNGLEFFKYCPILVNEGHYIIDGQHRFMACRKLKKPIFYVVVPNFSLRQVAEINNNQSKWKTKDFMNCYIDANVNREDYKALDEFCKDHKINISLGINLLMYGTIGSGGRSDAFRDGEFKVNFADKAQMLMETTKDYEPFFVDCRHRPFIQAIEKLSASEKYDHVAVLNKIIKHSLKLEHQSSCKEYLTHIEELYNYKNSIRQILY